MRYILTAVLALAFLSAPGIVHAAECPVNQTLAGLIKNVEAKQPKLYQATPSGLVKVLEYVNKNRAKMGKEVVDADVFMIAFFPDGSVGIALAKGGCLIPGMVALIDARTLSQIITASGMTSEDIEPLKEGAGA